MIEEKKELSGDALKIQGKPLNSMQCLNQLIIKITQGIESRFSDLKDVQFTEIANFSNWPVELKGISCIHL